MNHSHMLFSGHLRLTFIAVLKFYRLIQLLSSEVPFTSSRSSCGNPGTETFHFKSGVTVCSPAPPAAGSRAGRDLACLAGEVPHRCSKWRTLSWLHARAPLWAGVPAPCPPVRKGLLPRPPPVHPACLSPSQSPPSGLTDPDSWFSFTHPRRLVPRTARRGHQILFLTSPPNVVLIMLFRHSEKLNKRSVNGRALSTKIPKLTFYTVWSHGQPPVFSSTGAPAITRWYGGVHEAPLPWAPVAIIGWNAQFNKYLYSKRH